MDNAPALLLRSFLGRFDELRDSLPQMHGGVSVEDADAVARFLGITTMKLPCFVCQKETVVILRDHTIGGQDEDAHDYDVCVISGRKVRQKEGPGSEYVCGDCLRGKENLRRRVLQAVEPVLQRFDKLLF